MSISDEEFQRFQNQLVELKTLNYTLEERNKRITTGQLTKSSLLLYFVHQIVFVLVENNQLKTQLENFEKDSISFRLPTKVVSFVRP